MPRHLVASHVDGGRLAVLEIEDDPAAGTGPLTIHAANMRDRPLGRAGRWLLDNLRSRLSDGKPQAPTD